MSEREEKTDSKQNIPLLDEENFAAWYLQIRSYLRRKGLYDIVIEEPGDQISAAHKKKLYEAADIIIQHLGDTAFDAIVNTDNDDNPYLMWKAIHN